MATRVTIGAEPAKLVHEGNIDGQLPQKNDVIADAVVTAGKAVWTELDHGGVFAFNKRHIIVEEINGGNPKIVDDSSPNYATILKNNAPAVPFKLHPGEALLFSTGSSVSIVVREDVTRVI